MCHNRHARVIDTAVSMQDTPASWNGRVFRKTRPRQMTRLCLFQGTPASSFTPVIELFYRWNALDTAVSFRDTPASRFRLLVELFYPWNPLDCSARHTPVHNKYTPVRLVTRPCLLGDTPVWLALLNNCSLHTAVSNKWHARVDEQFPKRKIFLFGNLIFSQWSRYGFDKNQY